MSDVRPDLDQDMDARIDVDRPEVSSGSDAPEQGKPEPREHVLLREGADAPDAADIEDPERQL